MTIEDLKNVKLSPMTAGYLAIYIKLSDLCGEAAEVTEMDYGGSAVNEVNSEFDSALGKAQDEVMKLAVMSMTENLCTLSNNTELTYGGYRLGTFPTEAEAVRRAGYLPKGRYTVREWEKDGEFSTFDPSTNKHYDFNN